MAFQLVASPVVLLAKSHKVSPEFSLTVVPSTGSGAGGIAKRVPEELVSVAASTAS